MSFRRKILGTELITKAHEVARKEKHYKDGGSLITVTTEYYTRLYIKLDCGHQLRVERSGKDISKKKSMDCYTCFVESSMKSECVE